ncbi:hypothetical protein CQ12_31255 [Bradyrhizobium jicamae]|uniref:Uncharacterized protein n=1 Tax=Bradyrhizobium jicamae TaxID=280332 RepID=A0A0R3LVJ2_9BRAD|nr:hypothetical protein [Bradyrhizobium jicamae]KRR09085.1 hypothetical protein CQ12_31255 [Bradyrhizobium jicamae]
MIYLLLLILAWTLSGDGSTRPMGISAFGFLFVVPIVFVFTMVLSGIPAALTIWLSRKFRIRSLAFFCCGGATIGTVSQFILFRSFTELAWLFAVAGLAAGLTYWFVAGRYAGRQEPG